MSESEPKMGFNERNVCLPFPQPMIRSDGSPVWPFSQKGFPLFYGSTNFGEKCVEISDEMGVKALQKMGFFGFHSKLKFIESNDLKTNVLKKHRKEDSKQTEDSSDPKNRSKTSSESKYSNGKYVLISTSIPNALSFSDNQSSDVTQDKEVSEMISKDIESDEQIKTDSNVEQNNSEKVLKLSFLESFFLSYVFGSFNVLNTESNEYMKIEEMWETFGSHYNSEDKLEFAVHYSAYHYFRSKGWVVRNGHSFGTNFLLYREGPHLYHALYSVIIQYSIDGQNKQSFDWYYMSALIRLSKNVRKELIVCVINIPKDCDISSPKCIQDFEIGLMRFNRWNVTKTSADTKEMTKSFN